MYIEEAWSGKNECIFCGQKESYIAQRILLKIIGESDDVHICNYCLDKLGDILEHDNIQYQYQHQHYRAQFPGAKQAKKKAERIFSISNIIVCSQTGVVGRARGFYKPEGRQEITVVETDDGSIYRAPTSTWVLYLPMEDVDFGYIVDVNIEQAYKEAMADWKRSLFGTSED